MTPSEVLSDASNKLGGMTATNFTQDGTEYSVEVVYPSDRFEYISDLSGLMIDTPPAGRLALHRHCRRWSMKRRHPPSPGRTATMW